MADSKKYNGSTWEHSLRKLTTATDTFTTLPADIYANDTTATVGLKGNMEQASGVSPENPIQPSECGERTGNLIESYIHGCNIDASGSLIGNADFNMFLAKVEQGKTYCADALLLGGYYYNKPTIGSTSYDGQRLVFVSSPFTAPIDGYLAYRKVSTETTAMMNEGNELLPYEPFGVKIPISSANTTTPVYLGEVESTRRIKKLVLDGTEDWSLIDTDVVYFTPTVTMAKQLVAICSHYTFLNVPRSELTLNSFTTKGGTGTSLWIKTQYTSTADFKTFLQQQYAAGTPVTVWYVLAEPTTGIVNEPLRKIGDYADEVSGITIPTITGKDTFDVETTLKPSEVELTYTGWHDAEVKEWDSSQWQ